MLRSARVATAHGIESPSHWFQPIGAWSIAPIMALSLVVLVDLTYPFSGDLAISSDPFKTGALAQLSGR